MVLVLGVIAMMGLAAGAVTLTIGRRIARRRRWAAILLSGLLPPAFLVLAAAAWFAIHADVRGDGPAMALAGSIVYAILSLPLTLAVAALVVQRTLPR